MFVFCDSFNKISSPGNFPRSQRSYLQSKGAFPYVADKITERDVFSFR